MSNENGWQELSGSRLLSMAPAACPAAGAHRGNPPEPWVLGNNCNCRAAADSRKAASRSPARRALRQRSRARQARAAMRMSGSRSLPQREQVALPRNRALQSGQLKISPGAGSPIGGSLIVPRQKRGTRPSPGTPPTALPRPWFRWRRRSARSNSWLPPDRRHAGHQCAGGSGRRALAGRLRPAEPARLRRMPSRKRWATRRDHRRRARLAQEPSPDPLENPPRSNPLRTNPLRCAGQTAAPAPGARAPARCRRAGG